jgi:hypothetical protein
MAMAVPPTPAAVRMAWAGLAFAWRAVMPAVKAMFRAPDRGASTQAAILADRAAAHVALDDPRAVALLLNALWWAGTKKQAAVLLARTPAAHAAVNNSDAVAALLYSLREAGAESQAAVLADRAAAHAVLNKLGAVKELLDAVRQTGGKESARTLVDRLPAEGHFVLFDRQPGHGMRYRFGREIDGSPAPSWGWGDLD